MNKKYRFYWPYKDFSTVPPKRLFILLLYSVLIFILFSKSERERLGEFFGVDWGEEDLIPERYFVRE